MPSAKPDSPNTFVALGLIFGVLGGAVIALALSEGDNAWPLLVFGYAIAAAAWVVVMVGVLGAGVRLGMRHAAWENRGG